MRRWNFRRHQYAGAAAAYRSALALIDQSVDPQKFRRVVTDQLAMSLGLSGDLNGSREVNEAVIKKDPDYPLYYYDLACADAEAGNARAAQEHLQQAYNRRSHVIPGRALPQSNSRPFTAKAERRYSLLGLGSTNR